MYFNPTIRKFFYKDNDSEKYASKEYIKPIGVEFKQMQLESEEDDVPF